MPSFVGITNHQRTYPGDRTTMNDEDAERVMDSLLDQISGVVDALLDATGNDSERLAAVERRIFDRRRGASDTGYLNAAVSMAVLAGQRLGAGG
jgi:hypothetical protein